MITTIGLSGAGPPVPVRAGDMADAGGSGDQEHPCHSGTRSQESDIVLRSRDEDPRAAASKDGAVLPTVVRGPPRVGR